MQKDIPTWGFPGMFFLTKWRKKMKPSTKDEINGDIHEVKGTVKETAGKLTRKPNLDANGRAEQSRGKVQKKVGQIENVFEK
jgi:uncharacterized protein YjbJ (UPF0337 family)